jgi:hypothetical protein
MVRCFVSMKQERSLYIVFVQLPSHKLFPFGNIALKFWAEIVRFFGFARINPTKGIFDEVFSVEKAHGTIDNNTEPFQGPMPQYFLRP